MATAGERTANLLTARLTPTPSTDALLGVLQPQVRDTPDRNARVGQCLPLDHCRCDCECGVARAASQCQQRVSQPPPSLLQTDSGAGPNNRHGGEFLIARSRARLTANGPRIQLADKDKRPAYDYARTGRFFVFGAAMGPVVGESCGVVTSRCPPRRPERLTTPNPPRRLAPTPRPGLPHAQRWQRGSDNQARRG